MGELYKQAGGWHGVKDKFLIPLAEYQKSQGMDTSFTRLYDAYKRVDPIWRKLQEQRKPQSGGAGPGPAKAVAPLWGGGLEQSDAGEVRYLGGGGFEQNESDVGQPSVAEDYHRELAKRLRSYFRRPFDRWEQDYADDNSFYRGAWDDEDEPEGNRDPWRVEAVPPAVSVSKAEKAPSYFAPDLSGVGGQHIAVSGFRQPGPGEWRPEPLAIPKPPWMVLLETILHPNRKSETTWTLPGGGILYNNEATRHDPWAGRGS